VGGCCGNDEFLLQVTEQSPGRGAVLALVLSSREGLVENVELKGGLGCSDCEMVEFEILGAARRAHSKLIALDWRRADFGLVINDNTPFALFFSLLIFEAIKSKQTALGARGVTAPPTYKPSSGTGGLYILSELFVSAKSPPSFDSLRLHGIISLRMRLMMLVVCIVPLVVSGMKSLFFLGVL